MTDGNKTKAELRDELARAKRRIAELEQCETKLKHLEKTASEMERTLRVAITATREALLVTDRNGTVILANEEFARRLGKTADDLVGTCLFDHFPEDVAKRRRQGFDEVVRTGRLTYFEDTRDDASYGAHIYPNFGKDGEVSEVIIFAQDITKRKEAEEALRKSEEKYRAIFENALESVFQISPDGRFLSANPAQARMVGYDSPEELMRAVTNVGTQLYVDSGDREKILTLMMEYGFVRNFEVRFRRRDGSIGWASLNARLVRDDQGNALYHEGNGQDITERKRLEQDLRFKNALLSAQQETAIDGILVVDEKGAILLSNRRFREMWGVPADVIETGIDALVLQTVREKMTEPQAFVERVRDLYARPDETGRDEIVLKDGRTFDRYSSPLSGSDGHYYGRIWFFRDITERKETEAALKSSEERYRSIFENSPMGIFQSTFEGRFVRANPALARILGYDSPEDLIDSISDMAAQVYANPEDRARVLQHMREHRGQIVYENEYFRKDGRKWTGRLTMSIINDANGTPHHLDGIVEDVTEKKVMEEKLKHTMEQLRTTSHRLLEIQETERRYIARELHDEIGQTLTALRINLKRVERSAGPEGRAATLKESTSIVEELIRQVRSLSIKLRPSILDDFGLAAAMEWYINWLSARAGFTAAFHTDLTEQRFPPLIELTCFRILQEALTNAARHSHGKNVSVNLTMSDAELDLFVKDDGRGFDFDTTFQEALKGKSFGLLGMQERAVLAGGLLEVDSRPGKGTTVHARFPLEQAAEA